jgi:hypothetical protein
MFLKGKFALGKHAVLLPVKAVVTYGCYRQYEKPDWSQII